MTEEEVHKSINTPKFLTTGSQLVFDKTKTKQSFDLVAFDNSNQKYIFDCFASTKITLKLSTHLRNGTNLGLVRIDYNGSRHPNPLNATHVVPDFLRKYAGHEIEARIPHIHIYVPGDGLKWAIPLDDYFPLKYKYKLNVGVLKIKEVNDKYEAVDSFAQLINLDAQINYLEGLNLN